MTQNFRATAAIAALALSAGAAIADKADDTLRIAWGVDGAMANADNYYGSTRAGLWFSTMVWDTLIYRDPGTGEYQPNLATGWNWIDDQTLEMTLREGVAFHNGEAFSADDVAHTFNTLVAAESDLPNKNIVNWIANVEIVSPFVVRIHTKSSFPQAIEYLAGPLPIYPDEYYAAVGVEGMAANPVGTGPYRVVSMKAGDEYQLARNEDYTWGSPKGTAQIGNVVIREIPDVQTQVAELISGGIDVTADLTPDLVENLKQVDGVEAALSETLRIFYMGLDAAGRTDVKALHDKRVRQAISHLINRQSIVDNLMGGSARVIHTPCHPAQFGCDDTVATVYDYDFDKGMALLSEAGFADGFSLNLYAEAPAREAEAILGDLAKAGITADLQRMPWEKLFDHQSKDETPMWLTNWGSYSLSDAAASISTLFNGAEDDYARDDQVLEWLSVADTNVDVEVRKENYRNVIRQVSENAYILPLFSGVRGYGWNADLDFTPYPDEIPRFYEYGWK